MLEPSGDAKHSTYSREDDSARRLWLTQRTKANPWEHRTPDAEDEQAAGKLAAAAAKAPEALPTLIAQKDRLSLQVHEADVVENPFAKLVVHRIQMGETGRA